MSSFADTIAPAYLGEQRISLSLSEETGAPTEGAPVIVELDYAKAEPEGVTLPIVCTVFAPSGRALLSRVFTRMLPASLEWSPDEAGPHLVRVGEMFHNLWFGSLIVHVTGDEQAED